MRVFVFVVPCLLCVTQSFRLQTSKLAEHSHLNPFSDTEKPQIVVSAIHDRQQSASWQRSSRQVHAQDLLNPVNMLASLLLASHRGAAFSFSGHADFSGRNPPFTSLNLVAALEFSSPPCISLDSRLASARLSDSTGDTDFWASLRARQEQLETQLITRWREAECKSWGIAVNDWVRRVALDWPRAAIGTASGQVFVKDLTTGEEIACQKAGHPSYVDTAASKRDMTLLYGDYDGGGLTAIAFHGDVVVSAGRDGGAKLWRLTSSGDRKSEALQFQTKLEVGSNPSVVSKILLGGRDAPGDDGALQIWLAGMDGSVHRWEYLALEKSLPTGLRCTLTLKTESVAVLDIAILEELNIIACATADGVLELFALDDGIRRGRWNPFESRSTRARCVGFVPVARKGSPLQYCLVVGGSDGSIHARYLSASMEGNSIFDGSSVPLALKPKHNGPCVALTPLGSGKASGLFISGAHDGTCAVWDADWTPEKTAPLIKSANGSTADGPVLLYGLQGYKVWLGSVTTDGKRIVSDGCDSVVLIMDFSSESE